MRLAPKHYKPRFPYKNFIFLNFRVTFLDFGATFLDFGTTKTPPVLILGLGALRRVCPSGRYTGDRTHAPEAEIQKGVGAVAPKSKIIVPKSKKVTPKFKKKHFYRGIWVCSGMGLAPSHYKPKFLYKDVYFFKFRGNVFGFRGNRTPSQRFEFWACEHFTVSPPSVRYTGDKTQCPRDQNSESVVEVPK